MKKIIAPLFVAFILVVIALALYACHQAYFS